MGRSRLAFIPLTAVLVTTALGASTALAEETPTFEPLFWKVGGAKLEAGKEKSFTGESTGTYTLKGTIGGVKATVECKKVKVKGDIKGGIPATAEVSDEFGECSSKQCKAVTVTSGGPNLAWYGALWIGVETWYTEVYILGPPGKSLATVKCDEKSPEFEGVWASEILSESKAPDEVAHEVEGTTEYMRTPSYEKFHEWIWSTSKKGWEGEVIELELGKAASTLEGTSSMKLTSGEKFGLFT